MDYKLESPVATRHRYALSETILGWRPFVENFVPQKVIKEAQSQSFLDCLLIKQKQKQHQVRREIKARRMEVHS